MNKEGRVVMGGEGRETCVTLLYKPSRTYLYQNTNTSEADKPRTNIYLIKSFGNLIFVMKKFIISCKTIQ